MRTFANYLTEVMGAPTADTKVYTERGLSAYLKTAERILKDAQSRSGDFARMQDVHIAAVLGQLIAHITRIVNTVPKGTDPKTVSVAKRLLSLGSTAAAVKRKFDELGQSGAEIAARLSSELQGRYDMRFESVGWHPYELERDRITKMIVAAAKAEGLSNTQANKKAKAEIDRWKKAEGRTLHSQFERDRDRDASASQAQSEAQEVVAKATVARLISTAQALLRSAGFKSDRKAQGGSQSRYYSKGDIRVRISDHEVPLTAERQHNRSLRGGQSPWVEFIFGWRDREGYIRSKPQELDRLREWIRSP